MLAIHYNNHKNVKELYKYDAEEIEKFCNNKLDLNLTHLKVTGPESSCVFSSHILCDCITNSSRPINYANV